MAHPAYLREKAIELRIRRQLTIDEIAERLALHRSTIYYWVRDIPIKRKPATSWSEAARRKGNGAMQRKYRLLREAAYEEGLYEWAIWCDNQSLRDFVCLYIAEGYKRSRNNVAICNSDPAVMRLAHSWLSCLSRNPLRFGIQYHADQDLASIRGFWARELAIDPVQISLQRKSNSNQLKGRQWRSQHGVLTIEAGDTMLRAELQAWMDCLQDEWLDSAVPGA